MLYCLSSSSSGESREEEPLLIFLGGSPHQSPRHQREILATHTHSILLQRRKQQSCNGGRAIKSSGSIACLGLGEARKKADILLQ